MHLSRANHEEITIQLKNLSKMCDMDTQSIDTKKIIRINNNNKIK